MKKFLGILLSAMMLLQSIPVFAAEGKKAPEATLNAATETIVPGVNQLTGDMTPYTFEDGTTPVWLTMSNGGSVRDNPSADGNTSSKVIGAAVASPDCYPFLQYKLPKTAASERKFYISFKYLKMYYPTDGETPAVNASLWVMKNGTANIARSIGGHAVSETWKTFSGVVSFDGAHNAGDSSKKDYGEIATILFETAVRANPGETGVYFDDVMFVPSYQVTYHAGTGNIKDDKVLFIDPDETGAFPATYDLELGEIVSRYGYKLVGWTLEEGSEDILSGDTYTAVLENRDIDLYAVWEVDPLQIPLTWDFETKDTRADWQVGGKGYGITYRCGIMDVDLGAVTGADRTNTYLTLKNNVSIDAVSHRYFIFKMKNASAATTASIYFTTDLKKSYSEEARVNFSLNTNDDKFSTYIVDMSQNANWNGDFTNCMIAFSGATEGLVEIEDITLVGKYSDDVVAEMTYHFQLDVSSLKHYVWGQCSTDYDEVSRKSVWKRQPAGGDIAAGGAVYLNNCTLGAVSIDDMPILIFKAKNEDVGGQTGISVYFDSYSVDKSEALKKSTTMYADDEYTYFYIDFLEAFGPTVATGYYEQIMCIPLQVTTTLFEDIYFSNTLDFMKDEITVEKFGIYLDDDEITEDGGEIHITPYIRASNGSEDYFPNEFEWSSDNICGLIKFNDDGSATVTGKMNGTMTVTGRWKENTNYNASLTINVSGQNEKTAKKIIKYASYGNSIHKHSPNASIGWYTDWGMAASAEEKDYVHRLIYKLGEKYGADNVEHVWGTGQSAWETFSVSQTADYDYTDYLAGLTTFAAKEKPDIITIQYGENGGEATYGAAAYEHALTAFVEALWKGYPDAIILITCPFWGSNTKTPAAKAVAKKFDMPLADISKYGSGEYEAIGLFEHSGVAIHPGDKGMEAIAQEMFDALNPYMTRDIDPTIEYTTLPKSVTVSGDNTVTTAGGTASLKASVLPEDAAQDVVWTTDNRYIATIDENGILTAVNDGVATVTAASRYDKSVYGTYTVTISGQTPAYTVTYDKNTADTVTNMPSPNVYAKDGFVFDTVYPARETYTFLGWATEPDGEPVETIDVTKPTTVYAVWEKAYRWYFDRADFLEGFSVVNGFNVASIDGYLRSIATGMTDDAPLTVVSPKLDIPADDFDKLSIRILNNAVNTYTTLRLTLHTTNGDHNYSVPVSTAEQYVNYAIDLEGASGTITGFELRPTNIDATIQIDSISFVKDEDALFFYDKNTTDTVSGMPAPEFSLNADGTVDVTKAIPSRAGYTFVGWVPHEESCLVVESDTYPYDEEYNTLYALWDKNDHWEMDTVDEYSFSNLEHQKIVDGILKYDGGKDPIVTPKKGGNFNVNTTSGKLDIRMLWKEDFTTNSQVFFRTSTAPDLNETNSATKGGTAASDDFQDVIIDFTPKATWGGVLSYLRFDITSGAGHNEVDFVRFTDSKPVLVSNAGFMRAVREGEWDTVKYVVKKDGGLKPIGRVEITQPLGFGGKVDDSEGYIVLAGNYEIGEDAEAFDFNPTWMNDSAICDADTIIFENGMSAELKNETYLIPYGEDGDAMLKFVKNTPDGTQVAVYRATREEFTLKVVLNYTEDSVDVGFYPDMTGVENDMDVVFATYNEAGRLTSLKCSVAKAGEYEDIETSLTLSDGDTSVKMFFLDSVTHAPLDEAAVLLG